jgi:hypothetical protein
MQLYTSEKREPGQYFSDRFRHAWRRVPSQVRRCLIAYWQPHLALSLTTHQMDGAWACVGDRGTWLRFHAFYCDLPHPFHRVENTIAHELAHAYRWATGKHNYDDYEREEWDARSLAESWGFPQKPYSCVMNPGHRHIVAMLKRRDPQLKTDDSIKVLKQIGVPLDKARRWKSRPIT